MAEGYGTGMSARPLEITSGALSFMHSAVQARQQEIKSHMVEASENQKRILDALDVKKLGEASFEVRGRFDKQIGDFRKQLVDMYQSKQGRLSSSDLVQIESGAMKIHNDINDAKVQLEKYSKAQASMLNPNIAKSLDDPNQTALELGNVLDNITKGTNSNAKGFDAMKVLVDHHRAPTINEYISGNYGLALRNADKSVSAVPSANNVVVNTTVLSEKGVDQLGNLWMTDPKMREYIIATDASTGKPILDENGQSVFDAEKVRNIASPYVSEGEKQVYQRARQGSTASIKNLQTVDAQFGSDSSYDIAKLDTPKVVVGLPGGGQDAFTGEMVPAGTTGQVSIIGVGKDKTTNEPVLVMSVKEAGIKAAVTSGGKAMYLPPKNGDEPQKDPIPYASIESDPASAFKAVSTLKSKDGDSKKAYDKNSYTYKITKDNGDVVITAYGTVPEGKNWRGKVIPKITSVAGVVKYPMAKSTDASRVVHIPLNSQSLGYISKYLGKTMINGQNAVSYVEGLIKNKASKPAAVPNVPAKVKVGTKLDNIL